MRSIIEIDLAAMTMTVEAGCPLQSVQEAADNSGVLFPLDLGARGSASVGGLASTNAGGHRVLRYGMMRELILGLEVVLPNGTIISNLNKMLKNNAGYDLKHLFIGSEGTLGIITKVVLRLFPKPTSTCTAFCGVPDYTSLVGLLIRARQGLAGTLSAFEVMWPSFYDLAQQVVSNPPLPSGHAFYVQLDALGSDQAADQARFEAIMEQALEDGLVTDAVIAKSERESRRLWEVRDCVGEFPRLLGHTSGFDVSIPVAQIAEFVASCDARIKGNIPDVRTVWFGHAADSNLHLMIQHGAAFAHSVEKDVYETVRDWNGSISAEHGIGTLKKRYLSYSRSPDEIGLMQTLKSALDPRGVLNPGKVVDPLDDHR